MKAKLPMFLGLLAAAACTREKAQSAPKPAAGAPALAVTEVVSRASAREVTLPAELRAFQDVALHSKVQGFVEWIGVDRGSRVRKGQVLVRMSAPELATRRVEAEAKIQAARARAIAVRAQLAASEATYRRLKAAAATPGVVAENDLEIARQKLEADRARLRVWEQNEKAAAQAAQSFGQVEAYLRIQAPFAGVITERNVHMGSFVGPSAAPMLRLQDVDRLRLVVAVPEKEVSGLPLESEVRFTVPAHPGEAFRGVVRRVARALDLRTRTMPVEADVVNRDGRLAPGMFASVRWPVRRPRPSLFVPATAVVTTTERSFVVRIRDGTAEWVDVEKGAPEDQLVEVFGALHSGDVVAVRGTDELRPGTRVQVAQSSR